MLKKLYLFLDFFLPEHIDEQVDVATIFRARTFISIGILGIFISILLFIGITNLGAPLFIKIGIIFNIVIFLTFIIFLKTCSQNFEKSLNIGAYVQTFLLYLTIYAGAFSAGGLGFFTLIWLIPILLMNAYFFKPRIGAIFFIINFIITLIFINNRHDYFFVPLKMLPNFKELFLLYFILAVASCFIMSYLFVLLNEYLKEETRKQKSLLSESAKFQALGQMASNLAHDVNNPLFTIQGKLHHMRNLFSHAQLDLEKCDQIIEDVENTILRLSQIVKGVSTFARQGHQDQMVSVSVDEIIRGIVLSCSDRIVQSGITFDLKVDSDIRVICYPSYISQVLINLFNNALDALENVEVKLIQVEVIATDKWIEIHIKDSGPGVAQDNQVKIFDTFFTTKKYGKGVGLGLSISKGLIEAHGGMLKYQRIGDMTNFTVYLPTYE